MEFDFMKEMPRTRGIEARGRVAKWSKEQIDKLTTPELRALLVNAERLKEPEVAALCNELLDARPRGHAVARRVREPGEARRLVTRSTAFPMHAVTPRNAIWSAGPIKTDARVARTGRARE